MKDFTRYWQIIDAEETAAKDAPVKIVKRGGKRGNQLSSSNLHSSRSTTSIPPVTTQPIRRSSAELLGGINETGLQSTYRQNSRSKGERDLLVNKGSGSLATLHNVDRLKKPHINDAKRRMYRSSNDSADQEDPYRQMRKVPLPWKRPSVPMSGDIPVSGSACLDSIDTQQDELVLNSMDTFNDGDEGNAILLLSAHTDQQANSEIGSSEYRK
jgi:hypothetical protein